MLQRSTLLQRSYNDARDASPWWWHLYDVTANHSRN